MSKVPLIWTPSGGYECSTRGDKRFSALVAAMPDGRTIEMWYQCDIKGYDLGGTNWKLGKNKPPVFGFNREQQAQLYLSLWRLWTIQNGELVHELAELARQPQYKNGLSDMFARGNPINQANALVTIINEWGL